jgi:hypothetical protein
MVLINYLLIGLFIITFVGGMALGLTLGIITTVQTAAGQTPNTTPIIVAPNPTSGLTFLPQQAYVETLRPPQVQQPIVQTSTGNGLTDMLIPILTSLGVTVAAKVHSDKKTAKVEELSKDNMGEISHTKEVQKELARVTYDMNPEAAAKIENAPLVKLETLTDDADAFAKKAAKT